MISRALISIALVALVASPVLADDKERARQLHDKALRHYKVGEHTQAITYYREAYKAFPAAGILFNLAQAYRQNGDCALALQTYKNYLAEVKTGVDADTARGHIRTLRCATTQPEPEVVQEPNPEPTVSDPPDVTAETKRITDAEPQDGRYSQRNEALHHNGDDIPPADKPSVKKGEPGRHQHDQARRNKHETRTSRIKTHDPLSFRHYAIAHHPQRMWYMPNLHRIQPCLTGK